MHFRLVHTELAEANAFVLRYHRHHKPVVGHRFSIGAMTDAGNLCGVAIVGRPVARKVDHRTTLEVTRLCTDGTPNACSFLYASAARAGKALGYAVIQTYILESEDGASLRAAGWKVAAKSRGGQWSHTDGSPRRKDQPTDPKIRYEKILS